MRVILAIIILISTCTASYGDIKIHCENDLVEEGLHYKLSNPVFGKRDLLRKWDGKWSSLCGKRDDLVNYCEFLDNAVKNIQVYASENTDPIQKFETLYDFELLFISLKIFYLNTSSGGWNLIRSDERKMCKNF